MVDFMTSNSGLISALAGELGLGKTMSCVRVFCYVFVWVGRGPAVRGKR